jgi:hypothetical protein
MNSAMINKSYNNFPFTINSGLSCVTPLEVSEVRGVMIFLIQQIKAAESNSLNPSYVRGIPQKHERGLQKGD